MEIDFSKQLQTIQNIYMTGYCTALHILRFQANLKYYPLKSQFYYFSSTLATMLSLWISKEGNLPVLFRPGPRIQRICFLASFLTDFYFLLSFFSIPIICGIISTVLASSSAVNPPKHILRELGTRSGLKPDSAERHLSS